MSKALKNHSISIDFNGQSPTLGNTMCAVENGVKIHALL